MSFVDRIGLQQAWQALPDFDAEASQAVLPAWQSVCALLAQSLPPPSADQQRPQLVMDADRAAWGTPPLATGGPQLWFRPGAMELTLEGGGLPVLRFALANRNLRDAQAWLADKLAPIGLQPAELPKPTAQNPYTTGAPFPDLAQTEAPSVWAFYQELYKVLALLAKNLPGTPHHYLDSQSLGQTLHSCLPDGEQIWVALQPPDAFYPEFYLAIRAQPLPTGWAALAAPEPGHWHDNGWQGAALAMARVARMKTAIAEVALICNFIDAALGHLLPEAHRQGISAW